MNRVGRIVRRWGGWGCGSITTSVCCTLLLAGSLVGLDNYGLDLHFRYFSTIQADDRIVLIDIDDGSLEAVGDWPWPRRRHAEIVRTLHELGADQIALDIVFSEPSPLLAEREDLGINEGEAGRSKNASIERLGPWIDGDAELSEAIEAAGNVYLAMFLRGEEDTGRTPRTDGPDYEGESVRHWRARARESAKNFLAATSSDRLQDFLASQLPNAAFDDRSPHRAMLVDAFSWATARRASLRHPVGVFAGMSAPQVTADPSFPLERFAKHARDVAFVSYDRVRQGAVVREFVPGAVYDGYEMYQLGFLVGANSQHGVVSGSRDPALHAVNVRGTRLPIDARGRALINWHVARPSRDWRDGFTHIPAARLLEIEDARRAVAENEARLGIAAAKLVEARFRDTPEAYSRYVQSVNAWLDAKERLDAARADDRSEVAAAVASLRKPIDASEHEAKLWLAHARGLWQHNDPKDAAEDLQKAAIAELYAKFGNDELAASLSEKNERLRARIKTLKQAIGPQIAGKTCLVGYTASAQGDLVATPVHPAMPGVMVHANIVNMLLQGRIPDRASLWWNLPMLILVGALVTFASGARGWEIGVAATFLVAGLVAVVGAIVFATKAVHVSTVPAIATAMATWAVVTTWRQSTAERTRRTLTRALTQYASPAIASRIARELDVTDLAPESATITCFFCDLAGFTAMSERLGPARTRDVLNPYLATTSEELVAHGALVNKFIGDGVFAFFNAPILRCKDHATRACESALSIRRRVAQLGAGEDDELSVRVGIATGDAFVGDYGSGVKLDYTCIGDTVNVGSRLERAGKTLGVSVLVDRPTRDGAGSGFVFRPMGKLRVYGRRGPVDAFELLDPGSVGHGRRIASIERFAEAIRRFQCCRWDSCVTILRECSELDDSDVAPLIFARAAEALRDRGAPHDWDGALDVGS